MGEVFKSLVYCDYPDAWPGLLEAVYAHLTSRDELRVYGGLMALRFMARKYEFRDEVRGAGGGGGGGWWRGLVVVV